MDPFFKSLTRGRGSLFIKMLRKCKTPSVSTVPLKAKGQASLSKNKKSKSIKTFQKLVAVTVCSITAYIGYPFYSSMNTLKTLERKHQKSTQTSYPSSEDSQNNISSHTADVSNQRVSKQFCPAIVESNASQSISKDRINVKNDHLKSTPAVSTHTIDHNITQCEDTALNVTKRETHTNTDYLEKIPNNCVIPDASRKSIQSLSLPKLPPTSTSLSHDFSQCELYSDLLKQPLESKDIRSEQTPVNFLNKPMLNETLSPVTYEIMSTLHFFLIVLQNAVNQKKENITKDMKALHKCVCFLKKCTQELQDQEAYLDKKIQYLTMFDSLQKQWFRQEISVQQVIDHFYKSFAKDSFIFQLLESLPINYECNKNKKLTFIPLKSLQKEIITIHHDALLSIFLSSRAGLTAHMSALIKFFVFKQTGCLLPTRFFTQYANQEEHASHYQNIHFLNEAIRHASYGNIHDSYCNLRQIQGQFPILFKTWLEEIEILLTLLHLFDSISLYLQSY